MYRFQHPEYLWLFAPLGLVCLLFIAAQWWRSRRIRRIGEQRLVGRQFIGRIKGRPALRAILYFLAFGTAIIGTANPQSGGHAEQINRKGVDVIIALDVSKSMLAEDIQPSRLIRAKQLIERMLDRLHNDRVGLIVFAGRAYLQVPLTGDYASVQLMLQSVRPEMVPTQGTVIGDAIELAMKSFAQKERKFKSLVVISDGEDHDEKASEKAKEAVESGVVIYTVGVGSPEGAQIIDQDTKTPKLDESGQPVISKLNEEELQSIAHKGSGAYLPLRNADDVAKVLSTSIDDMEGRSLGAVAYRDYISWFQWFLLPALIILVIEWMLPGARPLRKWNSV